jgi:nitroreductase
MDFLTLTQQRYSERRYSDKKIAQEDLDYVLACAQMAPSAVNKQPWHFYVVQGESIQNLWPIYRRETFKEAPLCIVVTGNHAESWHRYDGKDHCDIDIAIVTEHMVLAAAEKGIQSCWVCNFDVEACKKWLNLPEEEEPMVWIPMGYASENGGMTVKKRKDLTQLVTYLP